MTVANDIKQPLLHVVRDEDIHVKLTHTQGEALPKSKLKKEEKKEPMAEKPKGLPPQEKGYIKCGNYDCL